MITQDTATVTIHLDTSRLKAALDRTALAARDLTRAVNNLTPHLVRHPANQALAAAFAERRRHMARTQAGAEARYYVRGGMDPAYSTPAARDAEVRRILAAGYHDAHHLAAQFLAGWATHRPEVTP